MTMVEGGDELRERLLSTFRVEAREHLDTLGSNLLALDRGLAPERAAGLVEATFREMHTLKGAARSVGMREVEEVCRTSEAILSRITHGEAELTPGLVTVLLGALDHIALLLAGERDADRSRELAERLGLAATEPPPNPAALAEPASVARAGSATVRLPTVRLDALLVGAEDLVLPKLAAGARTADANALASLLARCRSRLARLPDPAAADGLQPELQLAERRARDLVASLIRDERRLTASVDGLQSELRGLRMTPAAAILHPFPLMVRQLAEEQGKQVEWLVEGAELELDRRILETIKDPLIHLVRNAVAHGIELPDVRERAGKPPRGCVAIAFTALEGGRLEIAVDDDGSGVDMSRLRRAAIRAGVLPAGEVETLSDEDALELLYRSGISTSAIVTDLVGHGLGLAIVKEQVERVEGTVRVENRAGAGVTVRLVLPTTIATSRGLLVRVGGQRFLLPLEACESVVRIAPQSVRLVDGRESIGRDGGAVQLVRCDRLLGLPAAPDGEGSGMRPCVILRSLDDRIALLVDDVLGDRELLVKELGPPLVRVRNVAGAGVLGTGELVLILRPADLVGGGDELPARASPPPRPRHRDATILVADDSPTIRTMEKSLLEIAGYRVELAADGLEAWNALRTGTFDLAVLDVDMPGVAGFALVERIRADRELAELPVVLVTGDDSPEARERGLELGADAYVVKSSFDQSSLLEIISRLIARRLSRVL